MKDIIAPFKVARKGYLAPNQSPLHGLASTGSCPFSAAGRERSPGAVSIPSRLLPSPNL
jgi:hypothetical protein